jgi:hypothetical protein
MSTPTAQKPPAMPDPDRPSLNYKPSMIPWSEANKSVPAVDFVNFEQFPVEIMNQIWKEITRPRLIIWGPGGAQPERLRQADPHARKETNDRQRMIIRPLSKSKNGKYGMLVDWDRDLLYRNCKLPRFVQPPPPM